MQKTDNIGAMRLCTYLANERTVTFPAAADETYLSVTMSKTAPNLDDCPSARAACPSAASSKHEIPYASVQYFGWKLM